MNLLDVARSGPDVMSVLAAMLDASELCRVSLTCKALGGRQAGSDPQGDGLPPIEVAAMRVVEATATDYEKSRCDGFPLSGESWIEVYHRLLRYRATPQLHRLKVLDCCNADVAVERLAEIKDRLVEFEIRGPEHDTEEDREEDDLMGFVPPANIERVFKAVARLPSLRELGIKYGDNEGEEPVYGVSVERVGWLVAETTSLKVLRIDDMELVWQEDVVVLAGILSKCFSLQRLEMEIHIGYSDVTSVVALMQSLAGLTNLTELRLKIVAHTTSGAEKFAAEAEPILAACAGARGVAKMHWRNYGGYGGTVLLTNILPKRNKRKNMLN